MATRIRRMTRPSYRSLKFTDGVEGTANSQTPAYLSAIWEKRVAGLFDLEQKKIVLAWLSENWKRPRVVVVGSGFTLNAINPTGTPIPLWKDLAIAIEKDLNLKPGRFDALHLPDIHAAKFESRERLRRLLKRQLKDSALRPGRAHDALWDSLPAAVITTNFLDTLLEKTKPQRCQIVVKDADLGRHLQSHQRHTIYLHGHRSDPTTWIAGRKEYEELPLRQPMVHAKVRQLLAEFPALIVGYSLTDPDFHLIYGDTLRSMGDSRPKGLALLPTFVSTQSALVHAKRVDKLSRGYWKTLGLSFVKFLPAVSQSADDAYAKFFKLTERITTRSQLLVALNKPTRGQAIPAAFEHNSKVCLSALRDDDLAEVLDSPDERMAWWREALTRSLDDSSRKRAEERYRATNLSRFPPATVREGADRRWGASRPSRKSTLLDRAIWLGPPRRRDSKFAASMLEQLDGGDTVVREIEQLLLAGAERKAVREWLAIPLDDVELVPRAVDRSILAALTVLADGDKRLLQDVMRAAEQYGFPQIAGPMRHHLRAGLPRKSNSRRKEVRNLKLAFQTLESGHVGKAREQYQAIHDKLRYQPIANRETNLLTYFSVVGLLECTSWETGAEIIEELQRKRDALAAEPSVHRWRERIRSLSEGVEKSKAGRAERDGYEPSGMSWSASPADLWHQYERAKALSAPLSIRRSLLKPLLGTIPSAAIELKERLDVDIEDTGKWLKRALATGEFAVNRAAPTRSTPNLKRVHRSQASVVIGRQLFAGRAGEASQLPRRVLFARVRVIRDFPEIIRQCDIPKAVRLLASSSRGKDPSHDAVKAWIELSHVCSWKDVAKPLMRLVSRRRLDSSLLVELLRTRSGFPWEQWSECDRFWDRGGASLLQNVTRTDDPWLFSHAGWLLYSLSDKAPRREIIGASRTWLTKALAGSLDDDTLSAAASIVTFLPNSDGAQKAILAALEKKRQRRELSLNLLSVLSQPRRDRAGISLRDWANTILDRWIDKKGWNETKTTSGFRVRDAITEAWCLVGAVARLPQRSQSAIDRLFELFDTTWQAFPAIASILHPSFWREKWHQLLRLLRVGGHARAAKSWLLSRVQLVGNALDASKLVRDNLIASEELSFLRMSVVDGIANEDETIANNAIYVLPRLALSTADGEEAKALAVALEAAANDIRVDVGHGAAFTAAYIQAFSRHKKVNSVVLRSTQQVQGMMRKDPLAMIHRQLAFGGAKGDRHGRSGGRDSIWG